MFANFPRVWSVFKNNKTFKIYRSINIHNGHHFGMVQPNSTFNGLDREFELF